MTNPELEVGFNHQPYSLESDVALAAVHEMVVMRCAGMSRIDEADWLSKLTDPPLKRKQVNPYRDKFIDFAYWSPAPDASYHSADAITRTVALRTYAFARIEHALRVHQATEPFPGDLRLSMQLYQEGARLSNALRAKYFNEKDKSDLLILAHDLAIYNARFHGPDGPGYNQTMGHWLHLHHDGPTPRSAPEELAAMERRMRLVLALSELSCGPEETYAHIAKRDLAEVLIARGNVEEAEKLEAHYESIPKVKDIPSLFFAKQERAAQASRQHEKRTRKRRR